jgi:hypothetical protein
LYHTSLSKEEKLNNQRIKKYQGLDHTEMLVLAAFL